MGKKIKEFSSGGRCPICGKQFKSDDCPHSIVDAEARFNDNILNEKIRKTIGKKLKQMGIKNIG